MERYINRYREREKWGKEREKEKDELQENSKSYNRFENNVCLIRNH